MNLQTLAASIRAILDSGEQSLKDPLTRINVESALRRNKILQNPQHLSERAIMEEFFKGFVNGWPGPTVLDVIERELPALRDLRVVMRADEINAHVLVFPDSCRLEDNRQSLSSFKQTLGGLVLDAQITASEQAVQPRAD